MRAEACEVSWRTSGQKTTGGIHILRPWSLRLLFEVASRPSLLASLLQGGDGSVYFDLRESGFGAKDLEIASVRVAAHEFSESDFVAQHPDSACCVVGVHLLQQDRGFGVVQGTVHPSGRT